jgi:ATP-dependent protease Clp ATPase subunit
MTDGGNCSFCGKRFDQVFRLISSDDVKICSECIGRMADMIADEYRHRAHDLKNPPDNGGNDVA